LNSLYVAQSAKISSKYKHAVITIDYSICEKQKKNEARI
jgi:hypothetical protein